MSLRLNRRAAVVGALVSVALAFGPGPATAGPASPDAGAALAAPTAACVAGTGVTVVVNGSAIGAGSTTACAPGDPASGVAALQGAGFSVTPQGQGFVCRINGAPASDPCRNTPPADAYWSYWHAVPGGSWQFARTGAAGRNPAPGEVEGWMFGDGSTPPSASPPAPRPAPTTTTPPTTARPTPTTRPTATTRPAGTATPTSPSNGNGNPTAGDDDDTSVAGAATRPAVGSVGDPSAPGAPADGDAATDGTPGTDDDSSSDADDRETRDRDTDGRDTNDRDTDPGNETAGDGEFAAADGGAGNSGSGAGPLVLLGIIAVLGIAGTVEVRRRRGTT